MSRAILSFVFLVLAIMTIVASPISQAQDKGTKKKKAQEKAAMEAGKEGVKEDFSRVLPVFDPGSHTQPISAMGFTKDNTKLVTVGQDFTVQVWSTATGERLDILRLPGYGREKGYDAGRWDVAAVSADGTLVALGGQSKLLSADGEDRTGRLVIVDLVKRTVCRVQIRTGLNRPITAVAFSPNGETLAVAIEKGPKDGAELLVAGDLTTRIKNATPTLRTLDCQLVKIPANATELAFSPDGKRLAIGAKKNKSFSLWDVPAGATPEPKLVKNFAFDFATQGIAWSPDGNRFIHSVRRGEEDAKTPFRGFDLRTAEGVLLKSWRTADLRPALNTKFSTLYGVRFLDESSIYFVANGGSDTPVEGGAIEGGTIAGILDLDTGISRQLGIHPEGVIAVPTGTTSINGKMVAYTVAANTEVLIGSTDGRAFIRCGQQAPVPYRVGWSKDPAKPGFAWATERTPAPQNAPDSAILKLGFDLWRVEPIGAINGGAYETARLTHGDWSVKVYGEDRDAKKQLNDGRRSPARLLKGGLPVSGLPLEFGCAYTFIPMGDRLPLLALGIQKQHELEKVLIRKADGTDFAHLLPHSPSISDMVPSPDGRFLIATTGTPRLLIYRTDGSIFPLLSFAQLNGEWVIWTPEGYYAASPGGEKLFGWAINNGANSLVTFHAAEKYAKQFRRPDIIKLLIEKGSMKEALAAANAPQLDLNQITPPEAKLTLVAQNASKVSVKASASSGAQDKPISGMRLLLDGRPLADGKGVWTPESSKSPEANFEIDVPPGQHELKLLVRSADGATVSEPLLVKGPANSANKPTLYRICIGINDYQDPTLKLGAATQDARDMFDSLARHCVGESNRYGTAMGELILDKEATHDRVTKALTKAIKNTKPGDLLVIFFAGHGVKQDIPAKEMREARSEFFLLTHEADLKKDDLTGLSISGKDLRDTLSQVECPVLLIMDACHSAKAVKSFRPATDDLTRTMTDDTVGVTVLSAAMSHETAGATNENGHFTAGLLKGLKAETGVPFDPYERQLYVHHLYSVAFSEVRRATNGKQNPFLNMPWTSPPIALREVGKK
jgi:WD40 repeat protein